MRRGARRGEPGEERGFGVLRFRVRGVEARGGRGCCGVTVWVVNRGRDFGELFVDQIEHVVHGAEIADDEERRVSGEVPSLMECLDGGRVPFGDLLLQADGKAAPELVLTVQVLQELQGRRESVNTHV